MQEFIAFALNSPLGLIGWVAIIVGVFFFWPRGRMWLITFIVLLFIAVWAFNAIQAKIEETRREVAAEVDNATATASEWIPEWMKDLWDEGKGLIPTADDKICEYAGVSFACSIYEKAKKNIDQVTADVAQIEAICKASQPVADRFGEDGKTKFCAGNTFKDTQKIIRAILAGAVQGTVASVVPDFLVPNSPSLDTDVYLECLYMDSTKVPGANPSGCKNDDRHNWRLCVEFHMQLPSEELGRPPAPLEPRIQQCRNLALETLKKPPP